MSLADRIAFKLATSLGYDDEKQQVMAYGLGAFIQMMQLLLIAFLFGLVFDCLVECMIMFWGVGLLRRSTGGIHCKSYMSCILTSSLSICLLSLICRFFTPAYVSKFWHALIGIVPAFAVMLVLAWKRVPVASENKPITNPAKIARLRRQCFMTLGIYLAVAVFLLCVDWGEGRNISSMWALLCVLWWQSFTLTSLSERLVQSMDSLFQ